MLVAAAAATVVLALRFPAWPGPRGLADQRALLGIPNALDVLSNLPFALAGALGLARLGALDRPLRPAGAALYLSMLAVTAGSGLFHLAPGPGRLLLDRLPITLAFAALLALVLGDRVSARLGRASLAPLLAASAGTALLWYYGGTTPGGGDLRPYALVQALSLVVVPLLVAFFPGKQDERRLAAAVLLYGVAKLAEILDHELFTLLFVVSGHTLKHLLAAAACVCLVPPRAARVP